MNIELRSAEQVAEAIGVEVDTLYRYARKGRIRGLKVGKAWKFSESDIQAFLHRHRFVAPPHPENGRSSHDTPGQNQIPFPIAEARFAEIDAASNLLAENLLNSGIAPGDRVVVMLTNVIELMTACLAVWKAGAMLVPENFLPTDENVSRILRDSAPQALIVDRALAERLDVHRHGLEKVRVIFVKDRALSLSGLRGVRVESLDAVFEGRGTGNVIHLNGANPADVRISTSSNTSANHPRPSAW